MKITNSSNNSLAAKRINAAEMQLIDSVMNLLPIAAAGILIGAPNSEPQCAASTSEQVRLLHLLEVKSGDGPGVRVCRTGKPVVLNDLSDARRNWPVYATRAAEYHFGSVCVLPLRSDDEQVGAVSLFCAEARGLSRFDVAVGQALADVAAIGILGLQSLIGSERLNHQLQTALNSRVVIEQAKGVLAERGSIDVSHAFNLLRSYARSHQQRLTDLAHSVVEGADTSKILEPLASAG